MLVELCSDAFKSYGKVRVPIVFRSGLNAILGAQDATNSIGKSSVLLAIDFCFGGDDYVKRAKDIYNNVGPHDVKFSFEFDGVRQYFTRGVPAANIVFECDAEYRHIHQWSIQEFRKWLLDKYGLKEYAEDSIREIVGGFFRIYQRKNYDETDPLAVSRKQPNRASIQTLLKIFGEAKRLEPAKDAKEEAEQSYKAFTMAATHDIIGMAANRAEVKALKREAEDLEARLSRYDAGVAVKDFSDSDIVAIAALRNSLTLERRRLLKLVAQRKSLSSRTADSICMVTADDLEEMKRFFPGVDIKTIEEIQEFHLGLLEVLKEEVDAEIKLYDSQIEETRSRIDVLEGEVRKSGCPERISREILDEYHREKVVQERVLVKCDNYERKRGLLENRRTMRLAYENAALSALKDIEDRINERMKEYNDLLFETPRKPPRLTLNSSTDYSFETVDDTGTGTNCKGLVLLDVAILTLSKLPALVHDSVFLKQIGDLPLEGILKLYAHSQKQVFIALDKTNSYTKTAQGILERAKVLQLNPGGNEFFGWSWGTVAGKK